MCMHCAGTALLDSLFDNVHARRLHALWMHREEERIAVLRFLRSVARFKWGLKALVAAAGFVEFLADTQVPFFTCFFPCDLNGAGKPTWIPVSGRQTLAGLN